MSLRFRCRVFSNAALTPLDVTGSLTPTISKPAALALPLSRDLTAC
jgi:hypothetical protein